MSVVAPSFLAWNGDVNEITRIDGLVNCFHVDVMDNKFVPNDTLKRFSPEKIALLETKSPKNVHLMVENPSQYFDAYAVNGVDSISFHFEASKNVEKDLSLLESLGVQMGVALKPATPASVLTEYAGLFDFVLVMTVEPGFGGQAFMPEMLSKISELRKSYPKIDVIVDGGVNLTTGRQCLEAGASILVAGSAVFKGDALKNVEEFNKLG